MKWITRSIRKNKTFRHGTFYEYIDSKKNLHRFITLEMAEAFRKRNDFNKETWYWVGINRSNIVPRGGTSKLKLDMETGLYYAEYTFPDHTDILVSRLYKKPMAKRVKKFLDDKSWSITALNYCIRHNLDAQHKYAGIIPLREGFLIKDLLGNTYEKVKTIDEALNYRNELRQRGTLI